MPLSHAIADSFGWQWSFILLGILALATSIIVGTTLPRLHATNQHDDSKDRRQLKNTTLWIRYAISLLTIGSVYAGFSFFTPVLQNEAGFSANKHHQRPTPHLRNIHPDRKLHGGQHRSQGSNHHSVIRSRGHPRSHGNDLLVLWGQNRHSVSRASSRTIRSYTQPSSRSSSYRNRRRRKHGDQRAYRRHHPGGHSRHRPKLPGD